MDSKPFRGDDDDDDDDVPLGEIDIRSPWPPLLLNERDVLLVVVVVAVAVAIVKAGELFRSDRVDRDSTPEGVVDAKPKSVIAVSLLILNCY